MTETKNQDRAHEAYKAIAAARLALFAAADAAYDAAVEAHDVQHAAIDAGNEAEAIAAMDRKIRHNEEHEALNQALDALGDLEA